jgi:BirA family biotin operon repressor/biotin-[acetyl-CoA-carboxylase] ligase
MSVIKQAENIRNKDSILKVLMDNFGKSVPGKVLAELSSISRSGVWKHIVSLRKEGFNIKAGIKSGYMLNSVPDRLLPKIIQQSLKTKRVGKRIEYYESIDSTNAVAKELALKGTPDGTVVVAEHQTKGKGRLKRSWLSLPGENILFSVIFYPQISTDLVFRLTMLASIAAVKAVKRICKVDAKIKWPNDLYINGKKVCGVLTEFSADFDSVHYIVVGIGLNVNFKTSKNREIENIATSLMEECGEKISRLSVFTALLEELDLLYESFIKTGGEELEKEWNKYSMVVGRKIKIISGKDEKLGIAKGINKYGHLILLNENGQDEEIVCGDLSLRFN